MRGRPVNEQAAGFASICLLPLAAFVLLAATSLQGALAFLAVPLVCSGLAALVCRALEVEAGWALLYVVPGAGMCLAVAGTLDVARGLSFPF